MARCSGGGEGTGDDVGPPPCGIGRPAPVDRRGGEDGVLASRSGGGDGDVVVRGRQVVERERVAAI